MLLLSPLWITTLTWWSALCAPAIPLPPRRVSQGKLVLSEEADKERFNGPMTGKKSKGPVYPARDRPGAKNLMEGAWWSGLSSWGPGARGCSIWRLHCPTGRLQWQNRCDLEKWLASSEPECCEVFLNFCTNNSLSITNTMFKHKDVDKCTWHLDRLQVHNGWMEDHVMLNHN